MAETKWLVLKILVIVGLLTFVLASPVQATMTYPVTLTVQSGSETVSEVFDQPVQTTVEVLSASGNCIAKIYQMDSTFEPDPIVNLGFFVQAGSLDTTFTFSSSVVGFSAITNPVAVASSSVTLTDTDGNGATLTGLESGGKAYRAIYNGSVSWAYLNSTYSVTNPYDGQVESNRQPLSGFSVIPDTLTSIQSEYSFTLSAYDEASGTSTFNVQPQPVPEPLTMIAVSMGIAGLGGYIRRRNAQACY